MSEPVSESTAATEMAAQMAAVAAPRAEHLRVVQPAGYPKPRGYQNGIIARGPTLYIAGQVGWELDGSFASDSVGAQFARALDHVLAVVRAAGGEPQHVVRMTIYVTDLDGYRDEAKAIGAAWRARFGRVYPVMALVGVAGLVELGAKVEIEATAVLPEAALPAAGALTAAGTVAGTEDPARGHGESR